MNEEQPSSDNFDPWRLIMSAYIAQNQLDKHRANAPELPDVPAYAEGGDVTYEQPSGMTPEIEFLLDRLTMRTTPQPAMMPQQPLPPQFQAR